MRTLSYAETLEAIITDVTAYRTIPDTSPVPCACVCVCVRACVSTFFASARESACADACTVRV